MSEDFSKDILEHKDECNDYIELVNKLTSSQTIKLDTLIQEIVDLMQQPDYMLDIDKIQSYYLKISSELYIMVDKLKQYEIYSSMAKSTETESYNRAYLEASIPSDGAKKLTVAELQIKAGEASKKESLINTVYASALKSVKAKIDSGNMVADTLKNILKTRVNIEFTASQTNNLSRGVVNG